MECALISFQVTVWHRCEFRVEPKTGYIVEATYLYSIRTWSEVSEDLSRLLPGGALSFATMQ